ncbi:unnamed protein product, partial [Rotaria socialis]
NRRLRAISQRLSMLSESSYSPLIAPDDKYSQFSFENCEDTFDEDSNEYKYFLQDNDRSLLTKVEEHYTQAVRLNISVIKGYDNPCLRNLNDFIDVLNEPAYISALRMITLFKLTQEFNVGADYTEPVLIESQRVFHAQNIYIRLLWNYLNVRFGDDQTACRFSRLIFCCMKCHSIARETKETITKKDVPNKKCAPLMQSILQIL